MVRISVVKDRIAKAQVLEAMRERGPRTAMDIATDWSCDASEAKAVMEQLVREGVLCRTYQGANRAYEIVKPHTPGPWDAAGWYVRTQRTMQGGGFLVADCSESADNNGSANARLVAAAPEMLDALRALVELAEEWPCSCSARHIAHGGHDQGCQRPEAEQAVETAKEVIAKATGRAS